MPESSFPAIVTSVDSLNRSRRGIGRTHIHKFLFFAESWNLLRHAHRFSLYLHGPYSRELDGELLALRAAGVVEATPGPAGYGAQFSVHDRYVDAAKRMLAADAELTRKLDVLSSVLAPMGVRALEAISTAEFVRQSNPTADQEAGIEAVRELKPHLSKPEVETAMSTLAKLRSELGVDA